MLGEITRPKSIPSAGLKRLSASKYVFEMEEMFSKESLLNNLFGDAFVRLWNGRKQAKSAECDSVELCKFVNQQPDV